ncbi:Topoisomerase 1-associated factor 1 [Podosphaera aphanis]|nr:Topoisomerase 1-associated factor 1 [Podosphaera aphanis]
MNSAVGKRDVIDPEVRAYVSSLVTALGGSGADKDGRYVLGDDALACLRDLKRWLRLYDDKANRLDVARCLAESNLLKGDLLQILAAWAVDTKEDKLKAKTALACLELMVPLTWPLNKDPLQMTENHYQHIPYLQIAQLAYKRSIINFERSLILESAVRCALPSIDTPSSERTSREAGIIKLVLYFIRNIAMIEPHTNSRQDEDEIEISRSSTIDSFDRGGIFHLLLTISSLIEDFKIQDVIILEILFHLIKGVDVEKLFWDKEQIDNRNVNELKSLMKKEATMLGSYQANAPTRHNRFGAMAWMQREDAKMTTITGQTAIIDGTRSLAKMDSTKKYKPPRRPVKGESGPLQFDLPVILSQEAQETLRKFVIDFLDSGFNPLFDYLRKAICQNEERVMDYHPRQFFYLVSWFLQAKRISRICQLKKPKAKQLEGLDDSGEYFLVASVLNQEMFVTLNRIMSYSFESKAWSDLSAILRCFTQILLTVQEMSQSSSEEDRIIAENILNRLFYEETTHDRIASITRSYKDQGFGYLDSVTEIAHNYLRILERYSKENTDLQVRSKKARRKKKPEQVVGDGEHNHDSDDSEMNNGLMTERTSHERKFDFKRFSSRFVVQGCVDTFVAFIAYYNDLKPEQLKRVHRFFYRIAFKHDMSVMLFRVDIIALLHKMIKDPNGLDNQSSAFKEWDELIRQILRKCIRKIQECPGLIVEMLFSKTNSIAFYLEYGQEKQTSTTKPRPAAELVVKGKKDLEEQISIVVAAILDKHEDSHLHWIKSQLSSAQSERKSWEVANQVLSSIERDPEVLDTPTPQMDNENSNAPSILVKADDGSRQTAMFKNGLLRLLMKLVGFQNIGDNDDLESPWIVPSSLSAEQIQYSLDVINKCQSNPQIFDDGQKAADFIRRKSAGNPGRKRSPLDDALDDLDEELLFEPGGPTAMKANVPRAAKKRRRLRKKGDVSGEEDGRPTDAEIDQRNALRREKELEKLRKIKSELFVHDSDDETDEERDRAFFEREEKIRQKTKVAVIEGLLEAGKRKNDNDLMEKNSRLETSDGEKSEEVIIRTKNKRKRQSSPISVDDTSDDRILSRQLSVEHDDETDEELDRTLSEPEEMSEHRSKISVIQDLLEAGKRKKQNHNTKDNDSHLETSDGEESEELLIRTRRKTKRQSRPISIDDASDSRIPTRQLSVDSDDE